MPKTTILGKVSLTPQGDFVLGTAYHILDVVYSPADYAAFVALRDNEQVGLEDTAVWMKLVQGMEGKSAYTAAAEAGYAGTEEAFYTELAGIAASVAAAGASAEQAATSAAAAQADADRAQAVADQVAGLPGRMDALEGSVGAKPEGAAGTAWENIGTRPEGKAGSLWENAGEDLAPIYERLDSLENPTSVVEPFVFTSANKGTLDTQFCRMTSYGKIHMLNGELYVNDIELTSLDPEVDISTDVIFPDPPDGMVYGPCHVSNSEVVRAESSFFNGQLSLSLYFNSNFDYSGNSGQITFSLVYVSK